MPVDAGAAPVWNWVLFPVHYGLLIFDELTLNIKFH